MAERALVVDDDEVICCLLADALGEAGLRVTVCGDLGTARRHVQEQDFDWLFLDYNLPDGKGVDLLREAPRPAGLPVVITGDADNPRLWREAEETGVRAVFTKPFNLGQLEAFLQDPKSLCDSGEIACINGLA
jgi:DNA-binding response OmpR family regulator